MKRWSLGLVVMALLTGGGLRAQDDAPAILVWTHSLDSFVGQTKTLLDQIGRSAAADSFANLVKNKLGPKGFAGIDRGRPIGGFVRFDPDASAALIVPVSGQTEFLDLLDRMEIKSAKEPDGTFRLMVPILIPVYAKFAGQHVWITTINKTAFAAKVDPTRVFPQQARLLSARVRIDALPKDARQLAISQVEDAMQQTFKSDAAAPPAQKELTQACQQELARLFAQLVQEGKDLSFDVGFDAASKNLQASLNLTPKAGAALAKSLAEAGQRTSVFGADSSAAALVAKANVAFPEAVAKAAAKFVEDALLAGAASLRDERKQQAADLINAVKPTFEAGEIDAALRLIGPGGDQKMGVTLGLKTKDGDRLGGIFKTLVLDAKKGMTEAEQAKVMLDADAVGAVAVHRLVLPTDKGQLQKAKDVLGDSTLSVAFRPDALLVGIGSDSLPAVKKMIAEAKPTPAKLAEVTLDVAQLAPLLATSPKVLAAAPMTFAQKTDGFVQFAISGGDRLTIDFAIKTPVLRFLEQSREARAEEKK